MSWRSGPRATRDAFVVSFAYLPRIFSKFLWVIILMDNLGDDIYLLRNLKLRIYYSRFAPLFTAHTLEVPAFGSAALALLDDSVFRHESHGHCHLY